jgi:ABC-type glycerol-3-phosphate transport system substrate-binding protein
MRPFSRRSVLRGSVSLAAAGTFARPFIANAAAKAASVWWTQGFIPEEDASFRNMVAEYEKVSGNKIEATIIPFAPMRQKIISALTSGDVPDVMANYNAGVTVVPQNAWNDRLIDLSDVVATQELQYHPTALLASRYYNNVTKKRSVYYAPFATFVLPFHIWIRWSRRPATSWRTRRRPGMRSGTSSSRCSRSCATKACAASMPLACSRPRADRTTATICSIIF